MRTKKKRQKWLGAACLLEEQSSLPWERTIILLVIFVTLGFIRWAHVTPVDELVMTSGELVPETKIITLQTGFAGIVQEILVQDGSNVKEGDAVVKLQVEDTMEEIRRLGVQRKALNAELLYLNKEIKIRKGLSDEGLFPSVNLLSLYAKRKEILYKIEELTDASKYKFGTAKFSTIRAPITGQVQEVRIPHTLASLRAGETLMEIVPLEVDLFADLKIKPSDIGHVHLGQSVVLRITTFDPARYGVVMGTISYISPAPLVGRDGFPYFKGRVTLSRQFVSSLASRERHPLKTGMMADAEIKTGSKTILEYLLKPVLALTIGALHER